jgi:hypothetical protein
MLKAVEATARMIKSRETFPSPFLSERNVA